MSSNKNIKGKYGGNQMNSIKNDLYNLKTDFSNFINEESQRNEHRLFKKYSGQKSPVYDDEDEL